MKTLDILHIEDDPQARNAVNDFLRAHGCQVTGMDTGTAGLQAAREKTYDVVILDRTLPDLDGIFVIGQLREAGISTPVLMLSALGLSSNRIEGLDAGVDDYIAKPYEPDELLARLKALHRRARAGGHSPILLWGDLECHLKARTAWRQGRHVPLSPREFDLFRYFMENAGNVVTREMLLQNVWKLSFDPQTNVVDVSVARLRRKLEQGFEAPVLETVRGSGYRLLGEMD